MKKNIGPFQCSGPFEEGEVYVIASRTDTVFHPSCFQCSECATLLVDLIYFSHDGKVMQEKRGTI